MINRLISALTRALDAADRWCLETRGAPAPGLDDERVLLASLQAPRRVVVGPGHVRSGRQGVITDTIETEHGAVCSVWLDATDREDARTTHVPAAMLLDESEGDVPARPKETTDMMHARVRAGTGCTCLSDHPDYCKIHAA